MTPGCDDSLSPPFTSGLPVMLIIPGPQLLTRLTRRSSERPRPGLLHRR
jgi:hypothetical protein